MKWLVTCGLFCMPLFAEELQYGGSGCPQGSATITLNDKNELVFTPQSYELAHSSVQDRIHCDLAWALPVRPGYRATLKPAHIKGYISLKNLTRARFNAEYFFAGQQSYRHYEEYSGGYEGSIEITMPWRNDSLCGNASIARLNTSMVQQGSSNDSLIRIDNIILEGVEWQPCED